MLKIKMFLLVMFVTLSTYSVAQAVVVDGEGVEREATIQSALKTYTVLEGDNLYRIAVNHDVPLDRLKSWNGLNSELIQPGDVLLVGDAQSNSETTKSAPANPTSLVSTEKELLVTATAYTAYCKGCSGTTAYGIDLRANPKEKVIAVDPKVVPLGTKVWVEGYGEAIAGDIGGAIKGHRIDVFIPSYDNAMDWGVQKVKMRILN